MKLGRIPKIVSGKETEKIDELMLRQFHSTDDYIRDASASQIAVIMDDLKIIQSFFSKRLPPERSQGIMNLLYVNVYKNATSEEIESVLVMCGSVNRGFT